jgi:3-oxoacyl-[acyl-carrier protein] reductase
MDLGLVGKRAVVAAASGGLGFATARSLVDEGAQVVICGRDPERVAAAADSLGSSATGLVADVGTEEGATDFVHRAMDHLGGIDILVANAGGPPKGRATEATVDEYRAALDLNLLSTIAMALAAVPSMRSQGWGRILAITSVGARQPIPFLAASVTARAGATGFLKALAADVAADGVTVNSIQPGSHRTDRLAALGGEQRQGLLADIPVGELGDPADFGAVAAFLCSQQARFITGAALVVDGGASRGLQ